MLFYQHENGIAIVQQIASESVLKQKHRSFPNGLGMWTLQLHSNSAQLIGGLSGDTYIYL